MPAVRAGVLLPCYNAAATLPATLASLLGQTMPDFEVLAVDDGSADATYAVLADFAARDPRIRPIRLPRNQGIVAALGAGIAAARAPYLARMDADDLCLPERLAVQCAMLDADPGLDLVSGRVRFGGDRKTGAGYAHYVDWLNSLATHEDIWLGRFVESPLAHPSVMYRRSSYERLGGYRAGDFPEDYELWLRWLAQGARMAKAAEEVVVWNDPPGRLSRTAPEYGVDAFSRMKAGYLVDWLRQANPRHPEVWLWGAGRTTRLRLRPAQELGLKIAAYVDIDPRKVGQRIGPRHASAPVLGREAVPPASSPAAPFILSAVSRRGARDEIAATLAGLGYREGENWMAVG
jgi:glycosyltransferase involved in cell wall biosynthesis